MTRIEDYAIVGDCHTAALVGRDGSIDWLCFPRFDSGACFAALLGTSDHGRWKIAPLGRVVRSTRSYRDDTLVLETVFETVDGTVALVDFMPPRSEQADLVRIVECRTGRVSLSMELVMRFDYGSIVPWVKRTDTGIQAIAGPDLVRLDATVPVHGENFRTVADFSLSEGERATFVLTWSPSHLEPPRATDPDEALASTDAFWREWAERCSYTGEWRTPVLQSLMALKALTFAPTGGIAAAATTSLPEHIGGVRNWDYRFCWLRDASFTLYALVMAGFTDEARAWREWLLRAAAGSPSEVQIMYGLRGERRLTELTLSWLPGFAGSSPVRIGNAASNQFQLDVYGEVMDAMFQCRKHGIAWDESGWQFERSMLQYLETVWQQPDEGIWEVRGPRRHFVHSKVMAWVAVDRAVKSVEEFGLKGPVERWRKVRDHIHAEVCEKGFDADDNTFVQSYGSRLLDASVLIMALVGFLPATDPRIAGTVAAVEKRLLKDGFVMRYESDPGVDGLPPGEGAFLACSFWYVDNLNLAGRSAEARAVFERLLAVRNDVGLLAEEWDPVAKQQLGNFPQAFSHVSLVNSAYGFAGAFPHQAPGMPPLPVP